MTAPFELLRFGDYWKKSPKCPEFNDRKVYYNYILQEVIGDKPITFCEFGVYKGDSFRHWIEGNKSPGSTFWGFDSFQGLPETWRHFHKTYSTEHFDVGGNPPETDDPRAGFIVGFFQDTLDSWLAENENELREDKQLVIHLDADIYSATLYILTRLNAYIRPGTIILFDEFYSVEDEFKATMDWQRSYNRSFTPIASVSPFFQRLCIRVEK